MEAGAAGAPPGRGPRPRVGKTAPRVAEELPGLGVCWIELDARPRRSPAPVKQRLGELSSRFYGAHAIHMRERPIPWAYRVFFRHTGLDPDGVRTPVEQLALERLQRGAFKSRGLPRDALTIATVETGVALRAFDAERIEGELLIRASAPGESLPGRPGPLPHGALILADSRGPVGMLFGDDAEDREVGRSTRRIAIAAIQVENVPEIAVDEALWLAAATLRAA